MKTKQEKIAALEKRIRIAEANHNRACDITLHNNVKNIYRLNDKFKINACSDKLFDLKMKLQDLLDKPE